MHTNLATNYKDGLAVHLKDSTICVNLPAEGRLVAEDVVAVDPDRAGPQGVADVHGHTHVLGHHGTSQPVLTPAQGIISRTVGRRTVY